MMEEKGCNHRLLGTDGWTVAWVDTESAALVLCLSEKESGR